MTNKIPYEFGNRLSVKRVSSPESIGHGSLAIHLDDIPLWLTTSFNLSDEIWLSGVTEIQDGDLVLVEPATLVCRDRWGDYYCYGYWETNEEAIEWLNKPYTLH